MAETRLYIAGKDGEILLDHIETSQLTLPKCEQVIEKTNPDEPFSITLRMKVSDEMLQQIEEWNREFEQEREQAIKECAALLGVTDEVVRKSVEVAEKVLGMRLKPTIKANNIIHQTTQTNEPKD